MRLDDSADRPDQGIWIPDSHRRKAAPPPEPLDAELGEEVATEAEAVVEAVPAIDYHDKYLRLLADVENQRKRNQDQQRSAVERANERFVLDLLPVLDALQRGLDAAAQDASVEVLQQGMELVGKQLRNALSNHLVEPIVCAVGDEFDPERHEAMMRGPASEDVPEGHISAVLEPGYTLAGRVIRAARVAVAAPPLDTQAD